MKNLSLLGSTGSIGTQSLDVCRMHGYNVKCLTANSSVDKIEAQIREFKPELVCMMDDSAAHELKTKVADLDVKVVSGMEAVDKIKRGAESANGAVQNPDRMIKVTVGKP